MFVDTHCHFDFPPFIHDIEDSFLRATKVGVTDIIIPAVGIENLERVYSLAQQHPHLYAALGFHPLYIADYLPAHFAELVALLQQNSNKCVAIGEIGLDYFVTNVEVKQQQALLIQQLKLAKQYELPVILHSRKSHDHLAALLRRFDVPRKGVIHGFAGSLSQANVFVRLGYFIGIGGVITYERAKKTRAVVAQLPLTSLVLETDAPDMPLAGFQGQVNRPERIHLVFETLCNLRQEPAEEIAAQLYNNSLQLFNIEKKAE
ncbi:TatD family hydrolase [Arsenophonus apicola]|uniref:TatD family hydrolase n=1 Tax=Arsenophonus apicola TaxID=2879119 RepID=A0ABY8P5H4_9GAMM|nr:TatD family hydrolase [Arsenophonus apicola]WGO84065.1 TatD family hydrolase [Arsenophonus apicola]